MEYQNLCQIKCENNVRFPMRQRIHLWFNNRYLVLHLKLQLDAPNELQRRHKNSWLYSILGASWNHVYIRYIVVCISRPRFCKTNEFGSCTLMPWWYLQTKRCPASYFQLHLIRLRALLDLATRSWAPFNEESDWIPFVSGSCVQAVWNRGFSLSPLHCMVHTIHARFYVDISVAGSPSLLFLLTLLVGSKLSTRR